MSVTCLGSKAHGLLEMTDWRSPSTPTCPPPPPPPDFSTPPAHLLWIRATHCKCVGAVWVSVCSVLSLFVWPSRANLKIQASVTLLLKMPLPSWVSWCHLSSLLASPLCFLFWHTLCLSGLKLAQDLLAVDWNYGFSWEWSSSNNPAH